MPGQARSQLFCCRCQCGYRLCYSHTSTTAGRNSSYLKEAKDTTNDCIWLWILVSHSERCTARSLSLTCVSTCIVSVLRLVWLYPISITKDVTYESPLSALWSNVELNVGILCSCVPTLRSCMTRLFPSLFSPNPSTRGTQPETKPSSSNHETKRMTIQEISVPETDNDLEGQYISNENHSNTQPFSFIACANHDSTDAVHLTTLRSPPTTTLSKMHSRKASLPERVARWRESQGQKTTATQQAANQQQLQQPYPNNESMKNLLSEENETTLPMPERSRSRDGN